MDKITLESFIANLGLIRGRIAVACHECSRDPSSVQLLPVTKTQGPWAVNFALEAGLLSVGENRVQEGKEKKSQINSSCQWELIGHLQSNKVKEAVALFDRIQSVDSLKLIDRLDKQALAASKVMPILLQCNAGEDPNKYGFLESNMHAALECALKASNLKVGGLMTIAPLDQEADSARRCFDRLRCIRDRLEDEFKVPLPELSMGMTQDLEAAIHAGSTMIRVGTALYGERLKG